MNQRSRMLAGVVAAALTAVLISACGAPTNPASSASTSTITPAKPSSPVKLTILDGGGDLKGGGQAAIEAFVKANPDLVSSVDYETAAATDVTGKIKAQQLGGSVGTSLVLGGPDVFGAAQAQHVLLRQLPQQSAALPNLASIQDAGRAGFQNMSNGYGLLIDYDQNGPFIDYNAATLPASQVPATPAAILAWAKAHPGKFAYADPNNSGSGRAFIEALPYMLGDANPSDPVNGWSKTWSYLAQLGQYISSYPTSSTLLAQQFGSGQLSMIPTVISHDISFRQSSTYPASTGIALFASQEWITDGHYAMIPAGVSPQTLYVDLKLESFMVSAQAQAMRLTKGVLTSANRNVTTGNAGPAATAYVQQWGRPDFYPAALKTGTVHTPLTPAALQQAFNLWQRNVGAKVGG
ncbi:MAG TPA: extracellular solute-binding protein [Pseudonocardiaceae bacterium]|nr:extracellular solute-binding protein [Pseudonocardiaceae bacterium]